MFVSSSTVQAPLLLGEWEIHYLHKSEGGAGLQLQWGRKQAISSFLKLLYILNKLSTWRLKGYFNWLRFLAWFFHSLSVFCYFLYMVFCYASFIPSPFILILILILIATPTSRLVFPTLCFLNVFLLKIKLDFQRKHFSIPKRSFKVRWKWWNSVF